MRITWIGVRRLLVVIAALYAAYLVNVMAQNAQWESMNHLQLLQMEAQRCAIGSQT